MSLLQILPRLPGARDGVGDYALNLARVLAKEHEITTVFAVGEKTSGTAAGDFKIVSLRSFTAEPASLARDCDHVLLHYVNYGYQPRGVPFWLARWTKQRRAALRGRWLTLFHELYASAPPWKSAFWLQPWQKRIARQISEVSDHAIVSNNVAREQLRALNSHLPISMHAVPSNFGEPSLTLAGLERRDPHRWVICGGAALIARSLRSFAAGRDLVPEEFRPRGLLVLGGRDSGAIRSILATLHDLEITYRPEIPAARASEFLSTSVFGWIDYFDRSDIPSVVILKSSSFAAYCAHGIVPVFPHPGSPIAAEEDKLPGPFFVSTAGGQLPAESERAAVGFRIYEWYQRHGALELLAKKTVALLRFSGEPSLASEAL